MHPGGSLVRVDAGLSAPNAIAIAYPATASSGQVAEELGIQLLPNANTIHFVYDIIADQFDTTSGSYMEVTALDITSNQNLLSVREELAADGIRLTAGVYPSGGGSTFPTVSNVVAFDVGVWHHIDVVIDLTQTPATGSFSMDGKPHAVDAPIPGATFGAGMLAVAGGVYYANFPTTGWQVRMDNFAVWIQ